MSGQSIPALILALLVAVATIFLWPLAAVVLLARRRFVFRGLLVIFGKAFVPYKPN